MAKQPFHWSISNLFATVLLVVGAGLLVIALLTQFGTRLSVEATVTAAILFLAGLIFFKPTPFWLLISTISLISLCTGYAAYFSTPYTWLGAIIATVVMAGIVSYGFNLGQVMKRRRSRWYQ
ncbi:hypothetical protein C5Z25_08050 [Lactobacillus sp. CBA3605]|uniref:hypothetical protein n=1 Tax=Lactobacillus sp. CBA3605 TaxID=2099788 RepID=UPI000CFB7128|nr:hypothetical protein [Lactobacillus sp. CBA3605]AVK61732.1 hypothetical protein C5Z25_08050 [Lactobacillus sp. CBA3605]